MITASDIDARRKAVPFEPFRIVMSSGLIYDVYHPDMLLITKRTIYIGIYEPGRAGFPGQGSGSSTTRSRLKCSSVALPVW